MMLPVSSGQGSRALSDAILPTAPGPIGVFDSGYGGLTILNCIRELLPQYDYLYLGDNARTPYGTRSFPVVCDFTTQAVRRLFEMGCHLVILACNTASAKALRTIQQTCLPQWDPARRVLGVIRPTVESIGDITRTRHVGVVATEGTINSRTYEIEIAKLCRDIVVTGQACPMWVPLVENNEWDTSGAAYFVQRDLRLLLERDPKIDTVILGCTHYPLLMELIKRLMPVEVRNVVPQGEYVARSLCDYLRCHPDMDDRLTRGATCRYLTTEAADKFDSSAAIFTKSVVRSEHITL